MKKYVFTVMDDICQANGKDVNATELLSAMHTYGKVEDYGVVSAAIEKEFQGVITSLNNQLDALSAQNLTSDEIELLNAYRPIKLKISKTYEAENNSLKNQLQAIKTEHENRIRQISTLLGIGR